MNLTPIEPNKNLTTKINSALPQLWTYRKTLFDHHAGIEIGSEFDIPDSFRDQNPELFQPVGNALAKRLVIALSASKTINGNERLIAIKQNDIAKEIEDKPLFAILTAFREIKLTPGEWMPDVGTIVQKVNYVNRIKRPQKAAECGLPDFLPDPPKIRRRVVRWAAIVRKPDATRTTWEKKFISAYQPGKGL